jgi:uncharacterized membrane protein YgcG
MPRNRKHSKQRQHKNPESKGLIASITGMRLTLVIGVLIAILAFLLFRIGDAFWPAWMFDYRNPLSALVGFLAIFLALASPILVSANSDPRSLSGPGDYWIESGPNPESFSDSAGGDSGGDGGSE